MWFLLTVASLISALGTTHGYFGEKRAENPERTMNISQMISYWGYPSEEYNVVTEDGYILGIYRIPYGKNNSKKRGQRPVVLLQHGVLAQASNWISNLPNNSLGFILADAGYDVWMGNDRGNTWSRRHVRLSPDSAEFWTFSFDEIAKYDLPAAIEFILSKTGQEKLQYIGHSQGCTTALIAFSTNPTLAKRIKTFYALAPVATGIYNRSPLSKLLYLPSSLVKVIFGNKVFYPHLIFETFVATEICSRDVIDNLCSNAFFLIAGYDLRNLNVTRMDVYVTQNPAGTSVQNMLHWAQAFYTKKFQAYDWKDPLQNIIHYNQLTPPEYDLSALKVPIAVWSGGNDWLADPRDIRLLLSKLSSLFYHKNIPTYNHLDFIFGLDVCEKIYNELVCMLAAHST